MNDNNYKISITVNAGVKKAFENICNVQGWWANNFEGSSNKLNEIFTVRFGKTFVTFKIIEFIPNKKVIWLVTNSLVQSLKDEKEWNDTKIIWDVSEQNSAAKITMIHDGLVPDVECYDMCIKGWNFYTGVSLKELINEGKGLPDTPTKDRKSVTV